MSAEEQRLAQIKAEEARREREREAGKKRERSRIFRKLFDLVDEELIEGENVVPTALLGTLNDCSLPATSRWQTTPAPSRRRSSCTGGCTCRG